MHRLCYLQVSRLVSECLVGVSPVISCITQLSINQLLGRLCNITFSKTVSDGVLADDIIYSCTPSSLDILGIFACENNTSLGTYTVCILHAQLEHTLILGHRQSDTTGNYCNRVLVNSPLLLDGRNKSVTNINFGLGGKIGEAGRSFRFCIFSSHVTRLSNQLKYQHFELHPVSSDQCSTGVSPFNTFEG